MWRGASEFHGLLVRQCRAEEAGVADLVLFVEGDMAGACVVAGVVQRANEGHRGALEALRQRRAQRLPLLVPQVAPPIRHNLHTLRRHSATNTPYPMNASSKLDAWSSELGSGFHPLPL